MGYEPSVISSLKTSGNIGNALPSALSHCWAEVIPMGDTQGGTSRNILEHIDEFVLMGNTQLDILQ
jgi:hypothetical protein